MFSFIYRTLKYWVNWFSPTLLSELRYLGNKLSELGTEEDIIKFYRALDQEAYDESKYWLQRMIGKVYGASGDLNDLSYVDSQLMKAHASLQEAIYQYEIKMEKKKSFEEVTKYLNSNIKEACGQDALDDPDEEPTEITLPTNFISMSLK